MTLRTLVQYQEDKMSSNDLTRKKKHPHHRMTSISNNIDLFTYLENIVSKT